MGFLSTNERDGFLAPSAFRLIITKLSVIFSANWTVSHEKLALQVYLPLRDGKNPHGDRYSR